MWIRGELDRSASDYILLFFNVFCERRKTQLHSASSSIQAYPSKIDSPDFFLWLIVPTNRDRRSRRGWTSSSSKIFQVFFWSFLFLGFFGDWSFLAEEKKKWERLPIFSLFFLFRFLLPRMKIFALVRIFIIVPRTRLLCLINASHAQINHSVKRSQFKINHSVGELSSRSIT